MTDSSPDLGSHPRGTFALIGVFGALFAVGWLLIYFLVYAPRGAVTP